MPKLYVVCAAGEYVPFAGWTLDAWEAFSDELDPDAHWQLHKPLLGDSQSRFDSRDVSATVCRSLGPVLFVGGLKASAIADFHKRMGGRIAIHSCPLPAGPEDIWDAIKELIRLHTAGEPLVSRRLAVALMLVAKLEHMRFWGGNAKNFLSVENLAKGNGLDEHYKDVAREVAEFLASDHRLVRLLSKKLGDRNAKYACNNDERRLVYSFLRYRQVEDESIMNWLTRDTVRVSVRELDNIRAEDYIDAREDGV